jgi:ATP-dependent Clp protease adaptor protein ClpS
MFRPIRFTGRFMDTVSYANMIPTMASGQTVTTPKKGKPGVASPEIEPTEEIAKSPLYRVVLLDDDDHTYDYVIEMLQKIFIFTAEEALRHAQEVDSMGRTVLITCGLPEAEFARDQVQGYGKDWRLPRSKGSMSAIVEPVGDSA